MTDDTAPGNAGTGTTPAEADVRVAASCGDFSVRVAGDGYLRLVIIGEEKDPVDLLPFAAVLLDTAPSSAWAPAATAPEKSAPASDGDEAAEAAATDAHSDERVFGHLECADEVSFWHGDALLDTDLVLALLVSRVVDVMLDRVRAAQSA